MKFLKRIFCGHLNKYPLSGGCLDADENWFCPDCNTLSLDNWYRRYSNEEIQKEFAEVFTQDTKVIFKKPF